MYPEEYYYTNDHEWISLEDDVATIGITTHAQDQLGDIVYVEMPEVGVTFNAGDEFGTVESVKAVAEVFLPITGEILEINETLEENPELVNNDPFGEGWMIKVKIIDHAELEKLMSAEEYEQFVAEESK